MKYIIFALLLSLCLLQIYGNKFVISPNVRSSTISRSPSSDSQESCFKAILYFFKNSSSKTSEVLSPNANSGLMHFLKKINYKAKMSFFRLLSFWAGESESLNLRLAKTINGALLDDIITPAESSSIIKKLSDAGNRQLVVDAKGFVKTRKLANPEMQTQLLELIDSLLLKNQDLGKMSDRYREFFNKLDIWPEDAKVLFDSLPELPNDEREFERLTSYIIFASSFKHKKRMLAFQDSKLLFLPDQELSSFIRKFNKYQKRFSHYEHRLKHKLYKIHRQKHTAKEAAERSTQEAFEQRRIYEKLTYGCQARHLTPEHKIAMARFKKFYVGISLASGTIGYTINNRDKEKDPEWFAKLGFDLVTAYVYAWVGARIQSNPLDSYKLKMVKDYIFGSGMDLTIDSIYGAIFGVSEEIAQKRLEQLKNDPEFDQAVQKLLEHLEKEEYDKKFVEVMGEHMIRKEDGSRPIKPEDLDDEEIKDLILQSLAIQMYQEDQGKLLQTGNKAMDRFAFHRIHSIASTPARIGTGLLIYRTLCMGQANLPKALAQALGIYTAYSLTNSSVYFWARREAVNQ